MDDNQIPVGNQPEQETKLSIWEQMKRWSSWQWLCYITRTIVIFNIIALVVSWGAYGYILYWGMRDIGSSYDLPADMPYNLKTASTLLRDIESNNTDKYTKETLKLVKEKLEPLDSHYISHVFYFESMDASLPETARFAMFVDVATTGNMKQGEITISSIAEADENKVLPFYQEYKDGEYVYYFKYAEQWYTYTSAEQNDLIALAPIDFVRLTDNATYFAPGDNGLVEFNTEETLCAPFSFIGSAFCGDCCYALRSLDIQDDYSLGAYRHGKLQNPINYASVEEFITETGDTVLAHIINNYDVSSACGYSFCYDWEESIVIPEDARENAIPFTENVKQQLESDVIAHFDLFVRHQRLVKSHPDMAKDEQYLHSISQHSITNKLSDRRLALE